jgi:hypothetical protein
MIRFLNAKMRLPFQGEGCDALLVTTDEDTLRPDWLAICPPGIFAKTRHFSPEVTGFLKYFSFDIHQVNAR